MDWPAAKRQKLDKDRSAETTAGTTAAGSSSATSSAMNTAEVPKKPKKQKLDLATLPWWKDVDTSGKPPSYCSRMMGEVRRMFGEDKLVECVWDPPKEKDLSCWEFVYKTECIAEGSQLRKDLEKHKLTGIRCELTVPDKFPMAQPMIRVVHPQVEASSTVPIRR